MISYIPKKIHDYDSTDIDVKIMKFDTKGNLKFTDGVLSIFLLFDRAKTVDEHENTCRTKKDKQRFYQLITIELKPK